MNDSDRRSLVLNRKTVAVPGGPSQQVLVGGKGAPLVWLHGVSGVEPDDVVLGALASHFRIYAPEMPGRADLADLEGIDDVHDLALHYDSLLEALGLDRVTLVGHSFGAMLAAEIAAHVPKRTERLVLISPLGLWNDAYPVADLFARPYGQIDELIWEGATSEPPRPSVETDASREAEIERQVALVNGVASVAKFLWPIPDKGLRKRLHRISAPTLILVGAQDAYVPARYGDDFAAAIKGARKLALSGSHMLPYEQPEKIAAEIAGLTQAG
jgi:pimeloyl-ACP methyl ester carboxylesterase